MASFSHASPPTPCAHLYPPPHAPHALPILFISISPPAQYWIKSTQYCAGGKIETNARILNWKIVVSGWWFIWIVRWCTDLQTLIVLNRFIITRKCSTGISLHSEAKKRLLGNLVHSSLYEDITELWQWRAYSTWHCCAYRDTVVILEALCVEL
jgi:hypothetical protein